MAEKQNATSSSNVQDLGEAWPRADETWRNYPLLYLKLYLELLRVFEGPATLSLKLSGFHLKLKDRGVWRQRGPVFVQT